MERGHAGWMRTWLSGSWAGPESRMQRGGRDQQTTPALQALARLPGMDQPGSGAETCPALPNKGRKDKTLQRRLHAREDPAPHQTSLVQLGP